jgi:hypothetical protein
VFALRGTDLVRVSVAGGAAVKVQSLPGVMKLVGFDEQDADSLLAIFADKAEPMPAAVDIALVSVTTGKRTMVASHQAANTVETDSLLAWERQYGKIQVLPVGHEVVVRGVQSAESPITNCGEYAVCGQPAYSPELKLVVFVRSGA